MRNGIRAFFLIHFLALCTPSAEAQFSRIRFDHITPVEGLSQDIVTSIVCDSSGFMWFGTEDGLNRYDGYTITVYKHIPHDSTSLLRSWVTAVFVDSRGRLWVSAGGLHLYNEGKNNFVRVRPGSGDSLPFPSTSIKAICEDRGGGLWLGTDRGLARWDPEQQTSKTYTHDPRNRYSLSSSSVQSILVARDGSLWVGTVNGLNRFDPVIGTFTRNLVDDGIPRSRAIGMILSMYEDPDGVLWLGTLGNGLVRFDPKSPTARHFLKDVRNPASLGDNVVTAISPDNRGRMWIGHFSGLDIFDPHTGIFEHFSPNAADPLALKGSRVYSLYAHPQGAMWIGTYHGGVEYCDPFRNRFELLHHVPRRANQISAADVRAVLEDSEGAVWVGTSAGIDRIDPSLRTIQRFHPTPADQLSRAGSAVLSIFEDRQRTLWIGHADKGQLSRYRLLESVFQLYPIRDVRAIFEDRRGQMWFGLAEEGLIRYSPSTQLTTWFTNRPDHPDSLHGEGVWCIAEDREGRLWIGTDGRDQCLNRFDPASGRFSHFVPDPSDRNSISGTSVRDIYQDTTGVFWFGIWGGGLVRYSEDSGRFSTYLETDGLPSNYVKGILADHLGFLWVSSEQGLSRFDPSNATFKNYSTADGLQGSRFLSGARFLGKSGRMYFGGEHGLNFFFPDSIRDNPHTPAVRITSINVHGKPLPLETAPWLTDAITLSHDQDFFSFEYVALNFAAPDRIRYAYRMEGLDEKWIDVGKRRYAAFTHLDAGTYRFHVRAANPDGVWNHQGGSILISIAPPYWKTWWFRSLLFLSIVTFLYVLFRLRVSQILAVEELRQRIARDLHDDVGTNLSTISLASQSLAGKLSRQTDEQKTAERISIIARTTSDLMRDIVWLLKTNNDSFDDLVLKMRELAAQILSGITYTLHTPREGLTGQISLTFKRNIILFFKECLNNVARHSSASHVVIEVEISDGLFTLRVRDNGKGFDPQGTRRGSGLDNLVTRARAMGGTPEVRSVPNGGSEVVLAVKTTQIRHSFKRGRHLS